MAEYEITISAIDFDFSTSIEDVPASARSDLVSKVLGTTWTMAVEADENLAGPLCQKISNVTGRLVRDVRYTAKKVG